MKKGDFIWGIVLAIIAAFMLSPRTSGIYKHSVDTYPYLVGFIKFFILATMGELLANRIVTKKWQKTLGMGYKAILWGFYGMLITLIFQVFAGGTTAALTKGFLPGNGINFAFAFFASALMNLFFAPVMMSMHKITDTYVDMMLTKGKSATNIKAAVHAIDWPGFIDFIVFKTIPYFWIPAHTVSFLLPPDSRVAMAAMLSIAFGVIVAYAKLKGHHSKDTYKNIR